MYIPQKNNRKPVSFSIGDIGTTKELQIASFKPYIELIQTSIKKGDNGFDFINKKMTESEFIKLFEGAVSKILHANQFQTLSYPKGVNCEIRPLIIQGDRLIGVGFILEL